jgi:hypothetical protein
MKYIVHFVYDGTTFAPNVSEDVASEWDYEKDGRPSDETLRTVVLRLMGRFPSQYRNVEVRVHRNRVREPGRLVVP